MVHKGKGNLGRQGGEGTVLSPNGKPGSERNGARGADARKRDRHKTAKSSLPVSKRLGGLRYFEPKFKHRVRLDEAEIQARLRDAGFANEAEHQLWRQTNRVEGPVIRRSR